MSVFPDVFPETKPAGAARRVKLSIVIVNWNGGEVIARCLESLEPARAALDMEVCVVDNDSSDDSPAMLRRRFPWATVAEQGENLGFGGGCNRGLARISEGDYVLFLNPDTTIEPSSLAAMVRYLDEHPKTGAVTCALTDAAGKFQQAQGNRFPTVFAALNTYFFLSRILPEELFPGIYFSRPPAAERDVEWISGAVMMVRRSAVLNNKFFDESYFMYGEDMDASLKLSLAGWRMAFLPSARAVHHMKASTGKSPSRVFRMQVTSLLTYLDRYARPSQRWGIRALMAAGYVLRAFIYGTQGVLKRDPAAVERGRHHLLYLSYVLKRNAA